MYDPHERLSKSYLKFWGTRGSMPVSGVPFACFGGHTCCLEVHRPEAVIIIDAGTGIRNLGDEIAAAGVEEVHLFIGHTHWDHLIGLPFFHPLYEEGFTVHIHTLRSSGMKEAITRILSPDYFPVRYEDLRAHLLFHEVEPGRPCQIADVELHFTECDHPGGALGFRIHLPHKTIGYATDNEFLKGYTEAPQSVDPALFKPYQPFIDFYRGVDLMVHEAQYTPQNYLSKVNWGHSSISNATLFAREAEIREWWVTHHDPAATDEELRHRLRLHWTVLEDCRLDCNVQLAYDGLMIN